MQPPQSESETPPGTVFLVDDDDALREAFERLLRREGFKVFSFSAAPALIEALGHHAADVIVSDINMPGMNGIELLGQVRSQNLDLPVILVTGAPELETAIRAVTFGAFRYLTKPVDPAEFVQTVRHAERMHRLATVRRQIQDVMAGESLALGDRSGLEVRFLVGLEKLFLVYQPIVDWKQKKIFAYEALMRSAEPSLPHPKALLDAAERLESTHTLSRRVRELAHQARETLPEEIHLFVNLHPSDLSDVSLFEAPPRPMNSSRIVYEVTERARLDEVADVRHKVEQLRQLGYQVAVDDIGAGYAGLTSLVQLEPEFVKLDMELVRDIDQHPTKQRLVHSMVSLCQGLDMKVIAEGVETMAERDTVLSLGCNLLQGYFFAKPTARFGEAVW